MTGIPIEQALFRRTSEDAVTLQGQSPGFDASMREEAHRIIEGFGPRLGGVPCPRALFVAPMGKKNVAIVQVADQAEGNGHPTLAYRFLVLNRRDYENSLGDPFLISDRLPPDWDRAGDLGRLTWTDLTPPDRTVAQIQAVLKRVKAGALKEGDDPEAPDFERTPDNSESPALLGGSQVLVDGGRLALERKAPDEDFVRGLWTLLPTRTRGKLYPATFAYSGELPFDVVVVPRLNLLGDLAGYTTEEMASEYPGSSYELALQRAAEEGDQAALDSVLNRRDSRETLKLVFTLLVGMILVVVGFNVFFPTEPDLPPPSTPDRVAVRSKAAAAAGIIAVQDPLTMSAMIHYGDYLWPRKAPAE